LKQTDSITNFKKIGLSVVSEALMYFRDWGYDFDQIIAGLSELQVLFLKNIPVLRLQP